MSEVPPLASLCTQGATGRTSRKGVPRTVYQITLAALYQITLAALYQITLAALSLVVGRALTQVQAAYIALHIPRLRVWG